VKLNIKIDRDYKSASRIYFYLNPILIAFYAMLRQMKRDAVKYEAAGFNYHIGFDRSWDTQLRYRIDRAELLMILIDIVAHVLQIEAAGTRAFVKYIRHLWWFSVTCRMKLIICVILVIRVIEMFFYMCRVQRSV